MRIFSALGAIILACLGYTHIRRDPGEQYGFWFSFCVLFSGSALVYALQIRMYTWAALFVFISAIYAYRLSKDPCGCRNRIVFVLFSILAAYTHYFALFAVAMINLFLLIGYHKKLDKTALKHWMLNAVVQLTAYIPGGYIFLHQIMLGGADWITVDYPDLVFDFVSYYFLGDVLKEYFEYRSTLYSVIGCIALLFFVIVGICLYRRMKTDCTATKAAKIAFLIYISVILFSLAISLVRPIYYARYTVVLLGLLALVLSVRLGGIKNKAFKAIAALLLVTVFFSEVILPQRHQSCSPSRHCIQRKKKTSVRLASDGCLVVRQIYFNDI